MPSLVPYGLACEFLTEPTTVDEQSPRLSWRLRSSRVADRQSAYRLRVTAEPAAPSGATEIWDTGRTESDATSVAYRGAELRPCTRYRWDVEVRDRDGRLDGHASSWFETGLMSPDGWAGAAWITRDENTLPLFEPPRDDHRTLNTRHLAPCLRLRRAFALPRRPARARLYASAHGVYRASVNGRPVSDAELEPGWSDYRERVQYRAYDVTALLGEGPNVLAALVGDGWWSGFVGFDPRRAGKIYGDRPAFIARLLVEFPDGERMWLGTDERWRESPGPIRHSDLLMGEYHDARIPNDGWDGPGFDDAGWPRAIVAGRDTTKLRAARAQPVRVTTRMQAVEVSARPDGTVIADLGQNIVGRVRLTVRGAEAGLHIVLRHAEMLDPDGRLYTDNLRRAEARDVYVCSGAPVEVYEPAFTFHGFRYVELSGYPGVPEPGDVVGAVLHSDTPWTGAFSCSDPDVERLHANIRWGQRGNFVSVPTDCPQRDERLGWLADAQVFLPTAARGADVSAFFAGWMEDVLAGQDEDGAFGDVAPKVSILREGAPGWGDAGVIVPWTLYRLYGDERILERSYPAMVLWVEHIRRHNPDLVWRRRTGRHYGDWLQIGAETPREVLATAYFARSAELVGKAARVLGRTGDAERHEALAADVRRAFIDRFVEPDGRVHGDTQTGYLLALEFGLLPPELERAAAGHLADDVGKHDHHLTTGFIGVSLLCPVLTRAGRADLAYALLHQDTFPSWLFSVRHGATTVWERWDGWTPDGGFQSATMNSFNHYSLGAVGDWLYGGVAGIAQAPDSAGYRRIVLRPHPGGALTWASAAQETVRGRIESAWSLTGDGIALDVLIPPGEPATVHVPTTDPGSVLVDGGPATERVDVLARHDGELVCAVPPGRHRFTAAWHPTTRRIP
ncbi:glycoside hydrolase family 78 protein [Actinoallomurus sp. NBC_01490]|uniref:alpha-L-rhamnosidase n=1 Tax=Actinoallomurus sp. NBC_01490 TaxID=2903557 RepID=UPI002E3622DB|nr:family 78 glycoside hydrolase catalytic domain [Actinoallomurus sp. NBC_01490]